MKRRVKDPSFAPKGLRRAGGIPKRARRLRVEPCSAALRQAGSHPVWVLLAGGFFKTLRAV